MAARQLCAGGFAWQVAGVIGTTKLRYDMWGSDVLVASTLEGQCEPGRSAAVPHTRRTT